MLAAQSVVDWPKCKEIVVLMMQHGGEEIRHNALGRAKEIGPWLFRVT